MKCWLSSCLAAACLLAASVSFADYHTFQIHELYSNADGTVQYVVLRETQGMDGQNMFMGRALTSTHATVTKTYIFPNNLPGGGGGYYGEPTPSPTANARVLVGTQGFVALGLVTPDYVIPNGFLAPCGGTVSFAGVDQLPYASIPTDGANARYRSGAITPNLATNFAENSASVSAPPPLNFQGLWWNAPAGSESGWGINFAHQCDTIFASWFTYDLTGKGWWLVMTAQKTGPNMYAGTLFETRGPAFNTVPFDPMQVVATAVGTGTLTFSDASNGSFAYTVNGIPQTKTITREVFGPLPTCTFGAQTNLALATNNQDLWWKIPAGSESGWGVNFTHQGDTIFATWFTYDIDGTPLWLVVTAPKTAPGVYTGQLFRTTGPPFNAVPFNPASVVATPVGTATLTFTDGNNAMFAYTVQLAGMPSPVTQTKPVTREVFTAPGTVCL